MAGLVACRQLKGSARAVPWQKYSVVLVVVLNLEHGVLSRFKQSGFCTATMEA